MSEDGEKKKALGRLYMTREGYETLSRELQNLWRVERPRVTHEVEVAAAHGDRSENAEYIYGKKRLREIDRRLRYLKRRMEEVTVVDETPADAERVFFGAFVTIADEEGEEVRYRIVGADETDADRGYISIDSPLGRALLGKRLDDEVRVRRPKGEAIVEILEIEYV
ncbi:MAG: transcription elongation factor GreB [Myxococcota bacterium]